MAMTYTPHVDPVGLSHATPRWKDKDKHCEYETCWNLPRYYFVDRTAIAETPLTCLFCVSWR